ncbi:MAG: hypothetical protein ACE5JF_00215 [Anaerolineales bacterium]
MGRDLRRYSRQTYINLFVGFIFLLLLGGGGLVHLIYGSSAASTAVLCLLIGLAPLVLIGLALLSIQWLANRIE